MPEVFATFTAQKGLVTEGLKDGKIRRIRRGIYTTNLAEPLEAVVKRNLWPVIALVVPNGIVSHRTAIEGRPSAGGVVVVTGKYNRVIDLPGLKIRQLRGPGPLQGDAPFIAGLHMSSRPRLFLECLSGKVYGRESPFLSGEEIEVQLEKLLLLGEDKITSIRDQARKLSGQLNMEAEFAHLDAVIGTLLGTRSTKLTSKTAIARQAGDPYDSNRLEIFQALFEEMNSWPATPRRNTVISGPEFQNIGFFDAYFSNFIEGTEFEIDEAIDIAFHNKIPALRPEDAHDVLGTFRIVANSNEMSTKISELSPSDFLDLLRSWHLTIMQGRLNKRPGQFKEVANQAGHTLFVHPTLVKGTLRRGFELGRGIRSAFGRAAFFMFLTAEVHPFDDGNGRLARAVANAELTSHQECRLIIPTVFRVEYIDSLRVLSREKHPRTYSRMADQAQEFTAAIDFTTLERARADLAAWNAFDMDSDARLRRPR